MIKNGAFLECSGLTAVLLGEGIQEKIGWKAFRYCTSQQSVAIPTMSRGLTNWHFIVARGPGLTTGTLSSGLEEIGENALIRCTLL